MQFVQAFCSSHMCEQFIRTREQIASQRKRPTDKFETDAVAEFPPEATTRSTKEKLAMFGAMALSKYKQAETMLRDYKSGTTTQVNQPKMPVSTTTALTASYTTPARPSSTPVLTRTTSAPTTNRVASSPVPHRPAPHPPSSTAPGSHISINRSYSGGQIGVGGTQGPPEPVRNHDGPVIFPLANPLGVQFSQVHRTLSPEVYISQTSEVLIDFGEHSPQQSRPAVPQKPLPPAPSKPSFTDLLSDSLPDSTSSSAPTSAMDLLPLQPNRVSPASSPGPVGCTSHPTSPCLEEITTNEPATTFITPQTSVTYEHEEKIPPAAPVAEVFDPFGLVTNVTPITSVPTTQPTADLLFTDLPTSIVTAPAPPTKSVPFDPFADLLD